MEWVYSGTQNTHIFTYLHVLTFPGPTRERKFMGKTKCFPALTSGGLVKWKSFHKGSMSPFEPMEAAWPFWDLRKYNSVPTRIKRLISSYFSAPAYRHNQCRRNPKWAPPELQQLALNFSATFFSRHLTEQQPSYICMHSENCFHT